jgi:hypothetical protein
MRFASLRAAHCACLLSLLGTTSACTDIADRGGDHDGEAPASPSTVSMEADPTRWTWSSTFGRAEMNSLMPAVTSSPFRGRVWQPGGGRQVAGEPALLFSATSAPMRLSSHDQEPRALHRAGGAVGLATSSNGVTERSEGFAGVGLDLRAGFGRPRWFPGVTARDRRVAPSRAAPV